MKSYVTVTTDVDVDIDDIIDELDTEELEEALRKRKCTIPEGGLAQWIENVSGCKLYSLTDEDICRYVLIGVGRYVK